MIYISKEDGSRWTFDHHDADADHYCNDYIILRRVDGRKKYTAWQAVCGLAGRVEISMEHFSKNGSFSFQDLSEINMTAIPLDIMKKLQALIKAYKEWGPWRPEKLKP